MATKKITELASLAGTDVASSTDVVPIVDITAGATKKVTVDGLHTNSTFTGTATFNGAITGSIISASGAIIGEDNTTFPVTNLLVSSTPTTLSSSLRPSNTHFRVTTTTSTNIIKLDTVANSKGYTYTFCFDSAQAEESTMVLSGSHGEAKLCGNAICANGNESWINKNGILLASGYISSQNALIKAECNGTTWQIQSFNASANKNDITPG